MNVQADFSLHWIHILSYGLQAGHCTICDIYFLLTLLHSERPKLYAILAFLSAIGLKKTICLPQMGGDIISLVITLHVSLVGKPSILKVFR